MGWDSIPEDSASIANWVFKKLWIKMQDDYVITPSAVQGLFTKYETAAGASPVNTLWSNLINPNL